MDAEQNTSQPDMTIEMANTVGLNPKVVGSNGIRETILMILAVVQGFYLVFMVDRLPFAVRLTGAAFIGGLLLAFAFIKPRNLTFEKHLFLLIAFHTRPRKRVHQTADREASRLHNPNQVLDRGEAATEAKPKKESRIRPAFRLRFGMPTLALGLDTVDPGLIMAVFGGLLMVGSVLAYVGKGGRF